MNHTMQIGKRTISAASPTFIVAEVSANHNQNYDRAVEIIHAAAEAGADAVLAASIFHYGKVTIGEVKDAIKAAGYTVR